MSLRVAMIYNKYIWFGSLRLYRSVPDAASSMMRYLFLSRQLSLFHCVVEEEVNQNRVDLRIWMGSQNLFAYQLNTPYATT